MKKTPFLIALTNPINLAMLALIAAAGLCSAWWLAFPGLVIWLVMVLIIAREPTLQFRHVLEKRPPLAARFQKKFDPINRSLTRIFNTIASSKVVFKRALQPVLKTAVALVDQAYTLCQTLTPMENNRLVTNANDNGLLLELDNINTKIENATDQIIKREYQQAYDAIKVRLEQQDRFETQLDRVDAQLVSLRNDLDNLLSTIISLQSKPKSKIQQKTPEIISKLNKEIEAFRAFEKNITV